MLIHHRLIPWGVAAVLSASCAAAQTSAVPIGARALVRDPGTPIRDRLEPGDTLVTIFDDADVMVDDPPPPPRDALVRLLAIDRSYALAVVTVTSAASSLNDAGTWVDTDLRAVVQDVLRSSDDAPAVGEVIDVRTSGGQIILDSAVVRTDDRPSFEVSRRYLLSLGKRETSGRRGNPLGIALAIDQEERLSSVRSLRSALIGLSLRDVRDVLRSLR